MVKKLTILMFVLITSSCSSLEVGNDYPNQKKPNKRYMVSSSDSSHAKMLRNDHPADEVYNWPIKDAAKILENAKEGEVINAKSEDGKEVLFAVLSEYPSAGKKLCKKYFVNLDLHLACFNPHWYPVRSFEE